MTFNFNISINTLKKYFTVLIAIATLFGGFAALHYFMNLPQEKEKDLKLDYIIKQLDTAPLPVMDFVGGLPQLNDSQKRDIFETGMKLRDENKPFEAIKRFRLLLSMNISDEEHAALLILIGNSFLLTGNQDEALGHYKEALKAAENADSPSAKGVALGNIGLIYSAKGDADEALKYHQQALEIFREIRYRQGEANQLGNIGNIYSGKGDADEALKYLQQALEIFESIGAEHSVNQTTNIIKEIINSD